MATSVSKKSIVLIIWEVQIEIALRPAEELLREQILGVLIKHIQT